MGASESGASSNRMQPQINNKQLVDNLVVEGYIKTKKVEQVFRAIDRANYVLSSHIGNAYMDYAWKHGHLHLSSLSVYSTVLEGLCLEPGLSFLNLGSGTGYLNTMAGLILTQSGINHGVELHESCVKYAYDRLEEFKQRSSALDEYDFCEPLFIQGNCLKLETDKLYDRVYCGAACSDDFEDYMKRFVKVGGILVMPFRNNLCQYRRLDDTGWEVVSILAVNFASLIVPTDIHPNVSLPVRDPLPLQELCRGKIRNQLRQRIWREHSGLMTRKSIKKKNRRKRSIGMFPREITFMFDSDETSDGESDGLNEIVRDHLELDEGYRILMTGGRQLMGIFRDYASRSDESPSDSETGEPSEVQNSEVDSSSAEVMESDSDLESEITKRKKVARRDEPNESGNSSVQSSTGVEENPEKIEETNRAKKQTQEKEEENKNFGHYIDDVAFSLLMTENIRNLPLPLSLKMYVNYNRNL